MQGTGVKLLRYFTVLDALRAECQDLCVNSFALVLTMLHYLVLTAMFNL